MSNVTQQTAWNLKRAGMPQPEPEFGQIWYAPNTAEYTPIRRSPSMAGDVVYMARFGGTQTGFGMGLETDFVFAPSLDYITAYLPEGFILEMWDRRHSCKIETEDTIIRTQADSFAEAAALAYLELNKKT